MSYAGVIADSIRAQLDPSELVLWAGQPKQGVVLRGSDALMIPFSLLWGGFAFFWEWSVLQSDAPAFFALWGIPFVVVGVYIIVGRFFADAWQRSKTHYAVTSERIMIVDGLYKSTVRSAQLSGLTEMTLTEHANGEGTITFGPSSLPAMFRTWSGWPGMRERLGMQFDLVPNAKSVLDLVRSRQKIARGSGLS
jgi:hypothetical protein